jgi:hypothetical protein
MILTRDNIPFQEIMLCGKFDLTSHTAHTHTHTFKKINQPCNYICEYRSVVIEGVPEGKRIESVYRSVYINTPVISDHW